MKDNLTGQGDAFTENMFAISETALDEVDEVLEQAPPIVRSPEPLLLSPRHDHVDLVDGHLAVPCNPGLAMLIVTHIS